MVSFSIFSSALIHALFSFLFVLHTFPFIYNIPSYIFPSSFSLNNRFYFCFSHELLLSFLAALLHVSFDCKL